MSEARKYEEKEEKEKKEIHEIIDKFMDIKEKMTEIEKKHEKYRKIISDYMLEYNLSTISHKKDDIKYNIKKFLSARQTVSKEDLPKEIWEKYAKTSTFHTIRIDKERKKGRDDKEDKKDENDNKLFKR